MLLDWGLGGIIDKFAKLSFNKFLSPNSKSVALHLMKFWTLKTQISTPTLGAPPSTQVLQKSWPKSILKHGNKVLNLIHYLLCK
jgi:hypothetical protein